MNGRHLPSLNALLAFDAVARHLSFTRAGDELNITQAAVSHRISDLESRLDTVLVRRTANKVELTDRGVAYLLSIRPALAQIAKATQDVAFSNPDQLSIQCTIGFAMDCLIPALHAFTALAPDIRVRLLPAFMADKSDARRFDVAIMNGSPSDWPGHDVRLLLEDELLPVCSVAYLERAGHKLGSPADLAQHTVVRNISPYLPDEWPIWLASLGLAELQLSKEVCCSGLFFTVAAVREGLGIGLVNRSLIERDVTLGKLIVPFDVRYQTQSSFYLVSPPGNAAQDKVRIFSDWATAYFRQPS